jgi:hypothetical protein
MNMLEDLEYDTVDFVPNYDSTRQEPTVLPSKFPNLRVNGCTGIAVGMATTIPPHNVAEICDALLLVRDDLFGIGRPIAYTITNSPVLLRYTKGLFVENTVDELKKHPLDV